MTTRRPPPDDSLDGTDMQKRRPRMLMTGIALVALAVACLTFLRPSTAEPARAIAGALAPTSGATSRSTAGAASASTGAEGPSRPATSAPSPSSESGRSASAASGKCAVGIPARLRIPALGVDAAFETIGLDTSVAPDSQGKRPLGNPRDRTRAGWYASGPRPGSGTGTVLVNGHTYHDGSAIFKESFAATIATGQRIDVVQQNGSVCSYQVQRVWREVRSENDYPSIVASQGLYDFSGPERLFLATCGGEFDSDSQNYDRINMLVATPIDRG